MTSTSRLPWATSFTCSFSNNGSDMNEIPYILNRALAHPIKISFDNAEEAKLWVFRAHNFKRRKAPHFAQLMISRKGPHVTIRVPQFTVTEAS